LYYPVPNSRPLLPCHRGAGLPKGGLRGHGWRDRPPPGGLEPRPHRKKPVARLASVVLPCPELATSAPLS